MSSINNAVQITYDRNLADGLPGTPSDANPTVKETFIAEVATIPYGVVVSRGSVGVARGGSQTGRAGSTAVSATAGYAQGTGILETDIAVWNAITDGSFAISIDGVANDITSLDFSSDADLDAVAATIQTALQAVAAGGYTASTVVNIDNTCFKITSGTTGASSTVSDLSPVAPAAGTDISALSGLDTADNVDGLAASASPVLGVNMRVLISESTLENSGEVGTKVEEIGAVIREGSVKVLSKETAADNGDVYFDNTTGEIYASAGAGRTQLGTAKFRGAVEAGTVGVIDISGVRGA